MLLDTGGLTDRWSEVERRLLAEESIAQPHIQLVSGLSSPVIPKSPGGLIGAGRPP